MIRTKFPKNHLHKNPPSESVLILIYHGSNLSLEDQYPSLNVEVDHPQGSSEFPIHALIKASKFPQFPVPLPQLDFIKILQHQTPSASLNPRIIGIGGLFLYFLPYLILGQKSIWYANDYLELVVPWYKLLVDQKALFKPNDFPILGMLDQLPRGVFASEFFVKTWLFFFLTPFQAILFNKILIHLIAYLSMEHALKYFFNNELEPWQIQCIALAWATLAFWPEAGIAVAAFPSVCSMLHSAWLGKKLTWLRFLAILFYACYSLLHLHGVFVGVFAFFFGLWAWFRSKSFPKHYAYHFIIFTLLTCLVNYRHFILFFTPGFTPHRLEYNPYSFAGFFEEFWPAFIDFVGFGTLHSVRFNPMIPIFCVLLLAAGLRNPSPYLKKARTVFFIALLIGGFAVGSRYLPFIELLPGFVPSWFSWDRFIFMTYPLFFMSFTFALIHWIKTYPVPKRWLLPVLVLILGYNFLILDENHRNYLAKPLLGLGEKYPNYREFFAEGQFNQIKTSIHDLGGGKVASIGIHPAVAIYHGLHALDGYTGNYPLEYKHKFGEIIQAELLKSGIKSDLYQLFFGWGNKAYLFNQQLEDDFMRFKWKERIPLNTSYDWEAFQQLGGRFLISTEFINQDGIVKLKEFEHPHSAWKIYLYEME